MERRSTPLTRAIRACYPALGATFILSIFVNLTLFASPLYSLQVYDRVLTSRNLGTLLMLTLIVGLFIALYGFLEYARSGVLVRAGVRFDEQMSKPVFDMAMAASRQGREQTARELLKDADTLREGIAGGTVSTLFDIPWAPIFVALCFVMHPALGLVATVAALAIFACALVTELTTRKGLAAAGQHSAEAGRYQLAALRNAETIRGLGMGGHVRQHWTGHREAMIASQATSSERGGGLVALSKFVRMGVQMALLGTGAWLAVDGAISPGIMMAAMIIMGRALQPVEHAVANWKKLSAARAAHKRLAVVFDGNPEAAETTALPAPKGDLSVEELTLVPPRGGPAIVKGISFGIDAGTMLAVVGASGGGKSSLARALVGVWQPAKGAVRLDGAALTQWNADDLGAHLGYLPQEIEFMPGTVAENIARLGEVDDAAVVAAAQAAGVHQTILKMPKGYDTPIGEGGVVLSGGQRQRLALARALYGNPRLIVLDEPNSNLDTEGEAALDQALATLKAAGCTIVVVTHKPQLLRHADKVLVMAEGTIKLFGDRDEVMSKISGPKVASLRRPAAQSAQTRAEAQAPAPQMAGAAAAAQVL
ncbi:MAG: type I secretion system permease/ATPase [Hyphomicrobium sp.]